MEDSLVAWTSNALPKNLPAHGLNVATTSSKYFLTLTETYAKINLEKILVLSSVASTSEIDQHNPNGDRLLIGLKSIPVWREVPTLQTF